MAAIKKLTKKMQKEAYLEKTSWLGQHYRELNTKDFYREVFPCGSMEKAGCIADNKANGIMTLLEDNRARNVLVFDQLEEMKLAKGHKFAVMSPVTYNGRNRTAKNGRWMYGVTIDLDGVNLQQLLDFFYQIEKGHLPQCTCCVNSGTGIHVYYLLEEPVPLYYHLHKKLRDFKYELTAKVWNRYTSYYRERQDVQYQSIFQGFRVVGSQSKLGKAFPVRGYRTGEKVNLDYLNKFLMDKSKSIYSIDYKPKLSLEEAKEKYPEWYQRRVVEKKEPNRWHVKRDLYEWWKKKILESASVGHRYFCLMVLAIYAVKCDIPEDEAITDALALVPFLNNLSRNVAETFTRQDALDAMKAYNTDYVTFSRAVAEKLTNIPIPPNKRNHRPQSTHLKLARAIKQTRAELGEDVLGGRPNKKNIILDWRHCNPNGTKFDCIRETGLSKSTVYRWWNESPLK